MKRILLASAALFAVVALPALAQQAPVPATPPIVTPQPGDETTPGQAQPSVTPQAPTPQTASPQATVRTETQSDVTTPAPQVTAQTQAQTTAPTTQAQASTQAAPDPTSTAPQVTAQTDATAPTTDATATAQAETTTPTPTDTTASAQAETTAPTPAAQAQTAASGDATVTPTTAQSVCAPRNTSVHFGARGSSLSRQNQNAIQYATDAASVCNLQSVTIADSGEGRVSARRTAAVRQTLIRQGVPEERIQVEHATEGAATGQLDVRMTFAGMAQGGTGMASNETATTPPGGS